MKIKVLLFATIIIGVLSCEDNEPNAKDKLIDGIWDLETESANYVTLDFKGDMTYEITGLLDEPIISFGGPIKTQYKVTGEWELQNNVITFTTASLSVVNPVYSDTDYFIDATYIDNSYISQWDNLFQDSIKLDSIRNIIGPKISINSEYSPSIWTIEVLNNETLIVKREKSIITYTKQ